MNNNFGDARERAAQEERRRIRDKNRMEDRKRKIDVRRNIIIGEIIIKYFPNVVTLQPQLNKADTDIEFAGLEEFISTIAGEPKFSALFQELVVENAVGGNRQR